MYAETPAAQKLRYAKARHAAVDNLRAHGLVIARPWSLSDLHLFAVSQLLDKLDAIVEDVSPSSGK